MISSFLKNCWCQQKLKFEYLLIDICYWLEILHAKGPANTLNNKIKIYLTWRIYVMTSSFFENFKIWWRHQKFLHYGKNKMWNFKTIVIPTSVESFIYITFIYKEQWIKKHICHMGMSKRWRHRWARICWRFFSIKYSQIDFRKSHEISRWVEHSLSGDKLRKPLGCMVCPLPGLVRVKLISIIEYQEL